MRKKHEALHFPIFLTLLSPEKKKSYNSMFIKLLSGDNLGDNLGYARYCLTPFLTPASNPYYLPHICIHLNMIHLPLSEFVGDNLKTILISKLSPDNDLFLNTFKWWRQKRQQIRINN